MDTLVATMTDDLVRELGPKVRSRVEAATRQKVLATSSSDVLTFLTPGGRRYRPEPDVDYVKALWCFVRGKDMDGVALDSALTQPITQAVEEAIVAELNSEAARQIVARSVSRTEEVNTGVQSTLATGAEVLAEQIGGAVGATGGAVVADQIAAAASGTAADVLNTTAGKMIVASIVQMAGSITGKALLSKLVTASAAKVAGASLLKLSVAAGLKKIGLVILIKAILVKVLAVLLPGVALAKIPVFWVLLPVVGAFIYHELKTMPHKLAEKLPGPVGQEVSANFRTIAQSFAEMVLADVVVEVANAHKRRSSPA